MKWVVFRFKLRLLYPMYLVLVKYGGGVGYANLSFNDSCNASLITQFSPRSTKLPLL